MKYKYDIAISYAGEQRELVVPIVDEMKKLKLKVFVDYEHPERFWGVHLPEEHRKIYSDESQCILMFLSKEYAQKSYTNFEGRIICEKAIEGQRFLIIRTDSEATLSWLNTTIGYKDYKDYSPKEFADIIYRIVVKKNSL